jgi:hypothetical protein
LFQRVNANHQGLQLFLMRHSGILLHGWKITGDSGASRPPQVTCL